MNSVDSAIQLIRIQGNSGSVAPKTSGTSVCSSLLAEGPWILDAQPPSYGPGASMGDFLPSDSPRQGELPKRYRTMSASELDQRIRRGKGGARGARCRAGALLPAG